MTVLQYFDCEKAVLDDMRRVTTQRAKDAVCETLVKLLAEHRQFVLDTLKKLEDAAAENAKRAVQIYRGETPDYVRKLMAEFGFYELEECVDSSMLSRLPGHMRKDISRKLKSLCRTDDDAGDGRPDVTAPFQSAISDAEYDKRNAKVLAALDPSSDVDSDGLPADEFFKDCAARPGGDEADEADAAEKAAAAEKAKIEIGEFLKDGAAKRGRKTRRRAGKGRAK